MVCKFMKKIFILLSFTIYSIAGFGFYGSETYKGVSPNVCRVRIIKNNEAISICTGSLIGNNKVLTASHCVKGNLDYEIDCGYQGMNEENSKRNKTAAGNILEIGALVFKETRQVINIDIPKNTGMSLNDYAILTLNEPMSITPVGLASKEDRKDLFKVTSDVLFLRKNVECSFGGFGLSTPDGIAGEPRSAIFTPDETTFSYFNQDKETPTINILFSENLTTNDVSALEKAMDLLESGIDSETVAGFSEIKAMTKNVAPGDSGGGFFCKKVGSNREYLVASLQGPKGENIEENENDQLELSWGYRMTFFNN